MRSRARPSSGGLARRIAQGLHRSARAEPATPAARFPWNTQALLGTDGWEHAEEAGTDSGPDSGTGEELDR